ncbi:uncharacterized protein OCT59_005176 [Rhizophagus irregularis]|nr:hypothetical protein OCT59_005176 [Rhizophagus irregularis]
MYIFILNRANKHLKGGNKWGGVNGSVPFWFLLLYNFSSMEVWNGICN